jgi:hypothetical protein
MTSLDLASNDLGVHGAKAIAEATKVNAGAIVAVFGVAGLALNPVQGFRA